MENVRSTVPCQFCGNKIEFVAYLALSGNWLGSIHCPNCRYKWISHGKDAESIRAALARGGDMGKQFRFSEGAQVVWAAKRKDKEYLHGGIVLALLSPGTDPDEALVLCEQKDEFGQAIEVKEWQKKFRLWGPKVEGAKSLSHFRRYLVKELRPDGRVLKRKAVYYAPRSNAVEAYMDRLAQVNLVPAQIEIKEGQR